MGNWDNVDLSFEQNNWWSWGYFCDSFVSQVYWVSQKKWPIKLPERKGWSAEELIGSQGNSGVTGGFYHLGLEKEIVAGKTIHSSTIQVSELH